MDHRLGTRRSLVLPVKLERYGCPTAFGRVLNVSLSGAYIEISPPYAPFTRVDFVCGRVLYERIGASCIAAFVTRATAGGVAVEWFEFAAPVICRLVALARRHAVTGYGHAGDREAARRAGFDAYLVKPVDLGELEQLLAAAREDHSQASD